jgi:hypothetical protein
VELLDELLLVVMANNYLLAERLDNHSLTECRSAMYANLLDNDLLANGQAVTSLSNAAQDQENENRESETNHGTLPFNGGFG